MLRIRTAALAIALGLTTLSAAQASIDSPIHRTFSVRDGGTLTIEADLGDIRVSSGGTMVTIDILRKAKTSSREKANDLFRDYRVEFSQEQNDVRVTARYDRAANWFNLFGNDLSVQYVVTVPTRFNLKLATSGGDVRVGDINGDVRCRTSGGDLELGHIGGIVEGKTSGGDMTLAGVRGNTTLGTSGGSVKVGDAGGTLEVKTSGGSIDINRVAGDLFAHTSGGSISIREALGVIDASTSGGSIEASMTRQPRGDSQLKTSGGGIVLSLASGVALDLDAHTSGGDVQTDVPVTLLGKQSDSTLNGKVNGGGPKIVLRSSGGDIHLRKL
ncbi:MAG: DUF4097 family beta strand repeat-containing protein [Thermoanaerobaculia bacterium]